ncbi:ephexin isoform 1-T3 [Cochliomyia hominivorax]
MLDNIVTENCMASMPIETLADAKVNNYNNNNNNQKDLSEDKIQHVASTTTTTKTNKTKTILNWLKNTTTTNNNNNNNHNHVNNFKSNSVTNDNYTKDINLCNNHNNRFHNITQQQQQEEIQNTNCTCPKVKSQNNTCAYSKETTKSATSINSKSHKDDEGLREFRGVQTLKHFWNKRITANRESALRAKSSKHQFTKSVSCLVNAINNTGEPPPNSSTSPLPLSEKELLKARKLRAFSLHDCSRNSIDFDEISISDIDIQKHLEKDNFYKYKTAEQASKLRELSEHSTQRKQSNGIILPGRLKTERFDWLKRHDKFSRKKSIELTLSPVTHLSMKSGDNVNQLNANTSAIINNDIIINEHKMHSQQKQQLPKATGQYFNDVANTTNLSSEASTPSTLTAANSPQHAISRRRATTRKDSIKTLTSASSISRDSSNTSLATSATSHKTVVKRNSSARKYSFKTHARSYHAPRKMHSNKDAAGGASVLAGNPPHSLVAKLTQQFNEIIQKDKTLLEEIKRKNGVLMTHKGHVYKVVDTSSLNRQQSPSVSRTSSRAQDIKSSQVIKSSTVQKNIKKFESESRGLKPKVPLKSIKVLKKSNEVVLNKTVLANTRLNSNRIFNKKDSETKTEIKPQTLSTTLEMVQEEAKNILENTEQKEIINIKESNDVNKENVDDKTNEKNIFREINNRSEINQILLENLSKEEKIIAPAEGSENLNIPNESFMGSSSAQYQSADKSSTEEVTLVLMPQKIDSVIYKSIIKKKKNAETAKVKANTEKSRDNSTISSLIEEKLTNPSELILPNSNNETILNSSSLDDNQQTRIIANDSNYEKIISNTQLDKITNLTLKNDTKTKVDDNAEKCTSLEPLEDEDKRKRKHKYAKIYEKLRYFTPFSHNSKKLKPNVSSLNSSDVTKAEDISSSTPNSPISVDMATVDSDLAKDSQKLLQNGEHTPMNSPTPKKEFDPIDDVYSIMYNPEAKLLDALEQVDKKLQDLSSDNNERFLELDEYGQPLKPNTSFLHQSSIKEIPPTTSAVIQAVNVTLVNAIEGEQMIMEQKEIQIEEKKMQHYENKTESVQLPPLLPPKKMQEEEPLYEPICVNEKNEIKTDKAYTNTESNSSIKSPHLIEEDIYQTVEEAKDEYDHLTALRAANIVINSIPELDGYEPIENPDDSTLSPKSITNDAKSTIHFDGYEEYTPSVEPITTISTTVVRKVTDELPDLPKPKRILPKSPIPTRTAPKPPLPRQQSTEESLKTSCHEPSYYGTDENIYDTIKGFHCYESLQCVGNKMQNSPPSLRNKNIDSISLSSNCYESISHFKKTNIVGLHGAGSSGGSTLTISSENKTNSLYEDSLTSSLHYSSKRIYNLNVQIETNKLSITDVNNVNGYGGSVSRTTDTSDEWTDVTDNESNEVENKPQFIIVRERSKAHKSPDWSRRVRDKRQRKSKSCIEDDDPDHYYEQLSPLALNKRHSLLEQTRTNSLQRNQECVRVSQRGKKMSYSAHALGQHISDDSFDSDTDDYYESEHFKNAHNDSGVDIRTTKLPDPPTTSNQMYSFVKKFKNFIVNKKSPNSSKHGGSQQKIYDSSSQFYGEGKTLQLTSSLQVPEIKELSTSEKNLILAQSTVSKPEPLDTSTTPRKSKAGKSLRSRIRKSLVGFDNKQLSTLTPTRSTFYIEDPANEDNNGQLDSGFSEKALSGELPTASTPSAESQKLSTMARKAKKEAKLANSQRRRTTIGIRPHEPPPPPPPENNTKAKRQSNTSWYAECGVFKNGTTNLVQDESQILNSQNGSGGSTWYEEAGLYQTSGISVASSSGSSGVSTSNEAGPTDELSHSMFSNEPLYQIYSAAKLEAISRDMQDESSTDGYEEIGDRLKNDNTKKESFRKSSRPSALQLVEPKSGPERTLWSQIPEVINSYIIPTMTPRERALMEAKFEIITSEASYLKSLNLLRTHYMNHPVFRDPNIVSSRDRKSLFAHIVPVHECSEKLLTELESCWQDNIMLIGLSKRIYAVAEKHFHVYVGFCQNQGRMDRTLKHLREAKGLFAQNLELLESSPACCGLNLHSFLMLPMQRITRLPLLIDAVFSKCHPNDDEYENWKMCLAIMNKIVTQCNEAANKSEQAYEIEKISRQLEFNPSVIRPLAIAPAGVLAPGTKPRYLVKKGELTHLIWRGDDAKLTFGKKFSKTTIFAFLFSDLLVLTKRKAEEQFSVFDYCPRNMLTITSGDELPQLPTKDLNSQTSKNLILMTLLENHERKTVELLLSCPSVSEQERWLQAMRPPEAENPGEKLYESWDCPQVIAKHAYENNEPDVLNLDVGDVVNVIRKLPDGWYKGERIRDGAIGWFPGSYTEEVNSVHVRARNLKQRHRLLTFTATYLESQKRNK